MFLVLLTSRQPLTPLPSSISDVDVDVERTQHTVLTRPMVNGNVGLMSLSRSSTEILSESGLRTTPPVVAATRDHLVHYETPLEGDSVRASDPWAIAT